MSYKVGQLTNVEQTIENIGFSYKDIKVDLTSSNRAFDETSIKFTNAQELSPEKNYYLKFYVERARENEYGADIKNSTLDFIIYLITYPGSPDMALQNSNLKKALGYFQLIPYANQDNLPLENKITSFELMFTPNEPCPGLGFILQRVDYDYTQPPRKLKIITDYNDNPEHSQFPTTFASINNLNPKQQGAADLLVLDKIGVQSKPGFLMCINGEPIRVGKTGVYEIHNGYKVSFFGTPYQGEKFILDYAYNG